MDNKDSNDANSVLYKEDSISSVVLTSEQSIDIIDAYWCNNEKKKVDVVDYGKDIYIFGKTKGIRSGTTIQISIWEYINAFSINEIHRVSTNVLADQSFFIKLSLNSNWYKNNPNLFWMFFNVHYSIGSQELHKGFPLSPKDMLKINVVEEIPKIMKVYKWNIASTCQDEWFKGNINLDPKKIKPNLDLIKMEWALKFQFAREVYNEIFEEGIFTTPKWKNNPGKNSLVKQIKKMLNAGISSVPQEINDTTDFGTFSLQIPQNSNIPLIEEYYYTSHSKGLNFFNAEFNEYIAAVGSTTFHIAGKGKIKKLDTEFKITILQLGIYIKDGFEFEEGNQFLGIWNPKTNYMGIDPTKGVAVNNATYRDYQKRNNKGKNYYNYSNVKIVDVNYSFNVPHNAL